MPYIEEGLMEMGDFEIEVDYIPGVTTWDADDWLNASPGPGELYRHVLVYEGERLVAPPFVLLRKTGDDRGFVIGGQGIEWWQGGDIGPLITFAEFVSGRNRLSNADFAKGLDKWALSEGTGWELYDVGGVGAVRILTNPAKDDPVVGVDSFDVRPGQEWRATAIVARVGSGIGLLRLRIVLDGRFIHPNTLPGGTFEDPDQWAAADHIAIAPGGQRSGLKALHVGPIPKPQLIIEPTFASGGANWLGVDGLAFTGSALRCFPIPYPQLLPDPHLEGGGIGWGAPTNPDIAIVNSPGEARSGSFVMRVGPNIQHQVFINADFGNGLNNWFPSSTDAEPDTDSWDIDPTAGNNGTPCAHTVGYATAGRPGPETIKYLRADRVNGGGVDTYPVTPGEAYRGEAFWKAAPGTEGTVYVSFMLPGPTPAEDRWYFTDKLTVPPNDDMRWVRLSTYEFTIPEGYTSVNALAEVHNHGLGHWYVDTITMTRVRGNRTRITCATVPVEPNADYRLSGAARSALAHQVGSAKLGLTLDGPTVDPEAPSPGYLSNTSNTWTQARVEFSPREGYTGAEVWIEGEDIVGAPILFDGILLEKVSNNSRETTGLPFAVIPGQRYLLGLTHVAGVSVSRGTVTAGVRYYGDDLDVNVVSLEERFTKGEIVHPTTDATPPPGYTVGIPFVRFTDVEGGTWDVLELSLIKMDNNRAATQSDEFDVTPERTYSCVGSVISGADLQEGRIELSVRLTAPNRPTQEIPIGSVEGTDGVWLLASNSFTPPSGYRKGRLVVTGVDITAADFRLDDFTIVDSDSSTTVVDEIIAFTQPAGDVEMELTTTVPAGADRIHVTMVAEHAGFGWMAKYLSLARVTATPATAEVAIRAILVDPDTGEDLSVVAGDIVDAGDVISADWELLNTIMRDAMRQLATVVASTALEWYTDVNRRQHWGPAGSLFTDHAPGTEDEIVFLDSDLYVDSLSPMSVDGTQRADKVKLVGSERQSAAGGTTVITATSVDANAARDYNGRPSNRTLLLEDSAVDHQVTAATKAAAALADNREPARTLEAVLSETRTYPPHRPGDWVYGHKPSAGWVERGQHPVETREGTVFPRRARIIGRRRELGAGYRIVIRKGPGQEMELPAESVRWGTNRTTLTLGDRRPSDITTDASGRPAGDAVVRLRAQSPR